MTNTSLLFTPFRLGRLELKNRLAMAPMTRSRAGEGNVPNAARRRPTTRSAPRPGSSSPRRTQVSPAGRGLHPTRPASTRDAQVAGWRKVTDAVHAAGGRDLRPALARRADLAPALQPDGALPVAPSAIAAEGQVFTLQGRKPFVTPRALELDEIPGVVEQFARGRPARPGGGLRRRRAARRQRLPARPVPARRHQPAHGRLRRQRREPRALPAGGDVEAVAGVWGADRVGLPALAPTVRCSTACATPTRPRLRLRRASSTASASPTCT